MDDERNSQDHLHLITGLVGPYAHLFHTSASFHNNIEQLAKMLPMWVEAMATAAEKQDAAMKLAIEEASKMNARVWVLPDKEARGEVRWAEGPWTMFKNGDLVWGKMGHPGDSAERQKYIMEVMRGEHSDVQIGETEDDGDVSGD